MAALARGLPTVADVVIQGIFPLCFTPEMYDERPEFAASLADFVRGRPAQSQQAFLWQSDAVLAHDASQALGAIQARTLVTFGAHDLVTSTRFAEPLTSGIADSELLVFDHLSHGGSTRIRTRSTAPPWTSSCATGISGGSPARVRTAGRGGAAAR